MDMIRVTAALVGIASLAAAAEPVLVRMAADRLEERLVKRAIPVYPPPALEAQITGVVRFAVRVDTRGHVTRAILISGHPLLLEAAREAVIRYRYRPMSVNGRAVEMTGLVDVVFELPLPPGTRVAAAANWGRA